MSAHLSRAARLTAAALLSSVLATLPVPAGAQPAASSQWGTFIGGADTDRITALVQNAERDIVVVGTTKSINLTEPPTAGTRPYTDVFVGGFDYDGFPLSHLPLRIFEGARDDEPTAVALGPDGSVYIVGTTDSPDFTGAGAKISNLKGEKDAFLIRLRPSGEADWYMYLGGIKTDVATGVTAVGGSVFVSGWTNSPDFMSAGQIPSPSTTNGFVVRVDLNSPPSAPPAVGWNLQPRVVGGPGNDMLHGITSNLGNLLLAVGTTNSSTNDLRTVYGSRLKNSFKGGASDAWVMALDMSSGDPVWMAYVGGNGKDEGKAIARGNDNTFVVAGNSGSTDIANAETPTGSNVFAAWVTHEGGLRLIQLRGGERDEEALAVATDSNGTAYIGGRTGSTNLPRKTFGFDPQIEAEGAPPYTREGFVWMFPGWGGLGWDSFAGGNLSDEVTSLAVASSGQLIIGMGTSSTMDLPGNTAGHDPTLNGTTDGYLLAVSVAEPNLPQEGMVFDRLGPDDVHVDEETTTSLDSLFANWTEFKYNQVPLSTYEWAVGTKEDPTGVRNFSPATTSLRAEARGLNLTVGQEYIFTVRGQNRVGLTKGVQSSGVRVTLPDGGVGEPDGGTGEPDGGSGGPDGGPGGPDAGEGEPDGGAVNPDGGPSEPPDGGAGEGEGGDKESPLGWGCAAAGGAGLPLLLGLIAFVLLGRRQEQAPR